MKDQKKNNKGFSLVELIVVVAIMAVLLGVLVPTLVRNVEKSKKQKDISNLSEIRNALQLAMGDEKYAGIQGTLTLTGDGFTISGDNSDTKVVQNGLFDGTDSGEPGAFYAEVLANLNGGSSYTFTYASKLGKCEPKVTFTFGNERVTGVLTTGTGTGYKYNNESINLQDDAASGTTAAH